MSAMIEIRNGVASFAENGRKERVHGMVLVRVSRYLIDQCS